MEDDARRLGGRGRTGLLLGVIVLLLTVSACGFQLVGEKLPADLKVVYLQTPNRYSEFARELRAELQIAGARITESAEEASAVLQVSAERFDQRVLSVGSDGKVREFELRFVVRFSVRPREAQAPPPEQTATIVRDYSFDPTGVLGKQDEASLLRTEMQRDAARNVVQRLARYQTQ